MQTLQAANKFYDQQQAIAVATALSVKKQWQGMSDDFDASWSRVAPAMLNTVQLGRSAAATIALGYTESVLAETGQIAPATGTMETQRFLASAPNGQQMDEVLSGAVVQAKVAVKSGAATTEALAQAERWLTGVLLTVMADTGRSVVGADIAQRPGLAGYVRMLNAPSCPRCVILAGKWFRWNEGFLRHPRCDCRHIPASEDVGGDLRTDPYEYFHSLSEEQQTKAFGRIEARSINDGADIYRVVNLKARGLGTAKSAARYGTPTRMTIDDIYRTAGTRTRAIRMMESEGYITGPQVRGGNVIGTGPAAQGFGQLGKGGKARAASNAVLDANASGVRDPLNRYTMTAAERRLYDAHYRFNYAKRTGNMPRSIGANSADKFVRPTPATAADMKLLANEFAKEIAKLSGAPRSVQNVAEALGIAARNVNRRDFGSNVRVQPVPLAGSAGGAGRLPPRSGSSAAAGGVEPDDDQWKHILNGDESGGGHLFGANVPSKSEFPEGWDKARIADAIDAIQRPYIASGHAITPGIYEGVVDRVVVRVIVDEAPSGELVVISAIPLRGDGVFKNEPGGRVAVPLWSKDRR